MSKVSLQISPQPSTEELIQRFDLQGNVDVDAIPALEQLYVVPAQAEVELDFANVQRVNSMGLAQLLKLFEHWQKQGIQIRVINPNRMISMLFKMTGLTKFMESDLPQKGGAGGGTSRVVGGGRPIGGRPPVGGAGAAVPPRAAPARPGVPTRPGAMPGQQSPARAMPGVPTRNGMGAPRPGAARSAPASGAAASSSSDKLQFMVSLQSSQQLNGWFFFNTYLQRRINREIQMEPVHGALGDRNKQAASMDLIFTKPFDATRLILEYQYKPIVRPVGQTDEVTILRRANDNRSGLADFAGGRVVTASPDSFVYLLGRFLLDESGVDSQSMDYAFSGHEVKALQMLLKGEADLLFILSENYRGLSALTRRMLHEVDQTESNFAFHLFCISPQATELADTLQNTLLDMGRDSQGRQVLGDLAIEGWSAPMQDEIDMLAMLFHRYVTEGGADNAQMA